MDSSNTNSLLQLNRKLMELQLELKGEKQDFEKRCDALNNEINQVRRNINLCKSSVDTNKVNHAMTILDLQFPVQRNYCGGTNKVLPIYSDLVNAAKADLSTGATKLRAEYIGQKLYEGFDQRTDCRYGYGPSHGSIYQRIGLRNPKQELSDYDLECCLYLLENIAAVVESKNT